MDIKNIKSAEGISQYIEGCLNDFESGVSEKDETLVNLSELVAHVFNKAKEEDNETLEARESRVGDLKGLYHALRVDEYNQDEFISDREFDELIEAAKKCYPESFLIKYYNNKKAPV